MSEQENQNSKGENLDLDSTPPSTPRELNDAKKTGENLYPKKLTEEDDKYYQYTSEDTIVHTRTDESKAVAKQKSVLTEILKQIKPGVELYKISIPTFILHPISLLERISTSFAINSCMNKFEQQSAEFRILKIIGWLTAQWRNIPREGIDGSKPYNPIRGEVFNCWWDYPEEKSTTHFIAEQVSHHPPISAFYSYNIKKGIIFDGYMEPKTSFSIGSAATICAGRYTIKAFRLGEQYDISQAQVATTGLLWGKKDIAISGDLVVSCKQTGLEAKVNFGSKNKVLGHVMKDKEKLFIIDGILNENVKVQNSHTKQIYMLYDVKTLHSPPIKTSPIANQMDNESRKVWHSLTVEIKNQDFEKATIYKQAIEDRERKIEEDRKKKNEIFTPKLFKFNNNDWKFNYPLNESESDKYNPLLDDFKKDLSKEEWEKVNENFKHFEKKLELSTFDVARIQEFIKK